MLGLIIKGESMNMFLLGYVCLCVSARKACVCEQIVSHTLLLFHQSHDQSSYDLSTSPSPSVNLSIIVTVIIVS